MIPVLPPPPPLLPRPTLRKEDLHAGYAVGYDNLVCVTIPATLLDPALAAFLHRPDVHSVSREADGRLFFYTRPKGAKFQLL